ncbi:Toxin RelE4 [bacterium YEK0313]|nr:Toxin RelE4 [bacterium YEK0313]
MSGRSLRWTRRAVRRLDQIGFHIAKDDPQAAARLVARILSAVDRLGSHPAMGRVGRIKGTREYVFADIPYIVAYRVKSETVDIITVLHSAQRWPLKLD